MLHNYTMSTSIMAANAVPSAVARPLVALGDTTLTIDDSRDSDLDFDESFRTTGTQHSAYTLNDGDTTFDEDGYDDAQDKAAGRQSMDIDGEDDNEGLTESQIESKDKKRRRRTNKDEATVLSAVFEETAFPDVHTRTALAERLQMDLRSVSIWFQNKRQAMKKRASRYGGIDGVGSQSHDDYEPRLSTDSLEAPKKASLRRWASLDDVAGCDLQSQYGLLSRTSHDAEEHDRRVQTRETQRRVSAMMEPKPAPAKGKSCTAPLLDALRRCRGKSLARFVSLPGKTVQLVAPVTATADRQERNDLRELLFGAEAVIPTRTASMQRSASMMHLSAPSTNSEDEASLPGTQVGETSVVTSLDVISPDQIWKRMVSSSSGGTFTDLSTDANTDDSDKENASRDAICEDEERTLRKIANKRAAREQAKLEQKLSSQGARYLQEADARVALQQKTSKDASRPEALGLRRTPSLRDVGNGTDQLGRRSALSRVVSLDLSAGHDRSKAPGKALMQIMDEFERERQRRLARRVAAAKQAKEDAEAEAARRNSALRRVHSTPGGEHDSQGAWSSNHMPTSHGGYAHSHTAMSMPRLPQLVRSASGSLSLRPPARPLTRVLSSGHLMPGLMARHLDNMPRLSGYVSQHYAPNTADLLHPSRPRQSLSAQTSTKSVRSSSDDGASEGWTERWAREQRSISVRSSSERDRGLEETSTRGAMMNKAAKRTHETAARPANDTMPVFDDDAAEDGENVAPSANAGTQSKRRRVEIKSSAPLQQRDREPLGGSAIAASATSGNAMRSPLRALGNASRANASPMSSPLKSGNERDRLAAETLLGLGFQM